LIGFSLVAIFAPLLAPCDPYDSVAGRLQSPNAAHWMGTDNLGRDLLSRLIYGARISMYVGLAAIVIGTGVGVVLGMISGYAGRWVDVVIQRSMDIMMAFPGLILALALVAMLGNSLRNVLIAVAIGAIPQTVRVIRSAVLGAKEQDYVMAARVIGAPSWRIIFRHLLPNIVAPAIVLASVTFGWAIIVEASLSFLGLGIQPPTPSWGAMLSGPARRYMLSAPWMAIFPGLAISAVIFGINVFGDALRDVLDPRLRT
jgi:peptide/nickel transport system permease protein